MIKKYITIFRIIMFSISNSFSGANTIYIYIYVAFLISNAKKTNFFKGKILFFQIQ